MPTPRLSRIDEVLKSLFNMGDHYRYQNGHCAEMAFAIRQALGAESCSVWAIWRYPSREDAADEDADRRILSHVVTLVRDGEESSDFDYLGGNAEERWIEGFQELHPNSEWESKEIATPARMTYLASLRGCCYFDLAEVDRLAGLIKAAMEAPVILTPIS